MVGAKERRAQRNSSLVRRVLDPVAAFFAITEGWLGFSDRGQVIVERDALEYPLTQLRALDRTEEAEREQALHEAGAGER